MDHKILTDIWNPFFLWNCVCKPNCKTRHDQNLNVKRQIRRSRRDDVRQMYNHSKSLIHRWKMFHFHFNCFSSLWHGMGESLRNGSNGEAGNATIWFIQNLFSRSKVLTLLGNNNDFTLRFVWLRSSPPLIPFIDVLQPLYVTHN